MASPKRKTVKPDKPNIILIMADDLGAECLGCYGGQSYETPNLDKLASKGIRFENAYASPVCTPSRVEIMTGRYAFRTESTQLGDFFGPNGNILPADKLQKALENPPYWKDQKPHKLDEPLFSTLMKSAGYKTCILGKWQLGYFYRYPDQPKDFDFDEYSLWTWFGDDDYQYTDEPWNDDSNNRGQNSSRYWNPNIYQNGNQQVLKGKFGPDIFNDYALDFIERCDKQRESFFIYYPMCLPHFPLVKTPDNKDHDIKGTDKFAGMVKYMDKLVGKIFNKLEELGIAEDTILMFTGDNGTDHRVTSMLKGKKVTGGKSRTELSEEGNRVPLIAYWPSTIKQGQVTEQIADFSDFYTTLADAAQQPLPERYEFDGYSLLPLFKEGKDTGRKWTYRQIGNKWYIRSKKYRLRKNGEFADMSNRYRPRIIKNPTEEEKKVKTWLSQELHELRRDA